MHQGPVFPSLKPNLNANSSIDAAEIFRLYRFPRDVQILASILTERSLVQREQIKACYKARYKRELSNRARNGFADSIHYCTVLLLYTASELDALLIHGVWTSSGIIEHALIDIICTRNFQQIGLIQTSYEKLFKRALIDEINHAFSDPLRDLLLTLCNRPCNFDSNINQELAYKEAENIAPNSSQKIFTETIKNLFCLRSFIQINYTFSLYNQMYGRTFYNYLKSTHRRNYEKALRILYLFYTNHVHYFAKEIKIAIKLNDIFKLTSLICTRAEIDLASIQRDYYYRYGTYMHQDIRSTFEKDYFQTVEILVKLC